MTTRRILLWSSALASILLVAGAIGLSDGTSAPHPEITASPYVKLHEPEPTVSASSGAKVPSQPKPVVKTKAADKVPAKAADPSNIPFKVYTSTPGYVGPVYVYPPQNAPTQMPLPAPQQPPVAPITLSPQPVLPPTVVKPTEGLVAPLKPIIKPLVPPVLTPIIDPLLK